MIARGTGRIETDAQTAARRLAGHLRYQQYRPRSRSEQHADRWIFSVAANRVRQADVLAAVVAPGALQVVLHTFVLAPEAEVVRDWRAWTRQVMGDLEAQALCWFGVLHQDTARPHVHIGLINAQATSPRLLQGHQRPDHTKHLPARRQGGVLLRLPQTRAKESC